ncbi:Glu-tRNA(Gln) amidotransferase subunit GatD [Candidatus Woesearchaeota archaeon]|nr:Glu-tRNA(Gln) amidotransferase subunit GatD [Candidatus Woesearchaeota archaeon]
MKDAKAGDSVRITTPDGTFEGTLLPRPELLNKDVIVLKLKTGYNIGISAKKAKKVEILETYKTPIPKKGKIPFNKNLPTVAILSTGGTIASRIDYRTGGVYADYTAEDFISMCPELTGIANIKAVKVMSMMSEDATSDDWNTMAQTIAKTLPEVDGIVVTHGTDTMHYTSSALSFLLKNLTKPVIITGAQRSIDRGSSDAFMNLACAVNAAANWDGAEVCICMHSTMSDDACWLLRGTKVRKMHTSRRDAFRPINDEPLARVTPDGKIEPMSSYRKRNGGSTTLRKAGKDAALILIHPNMDPGIIEYHIKQKIKGIVLAATALGHVPLNNPRSLENALRKAVKAGIPIFICSQTLYGRVNPYVYAGLRKLSIEIGAHYLFDMLPETAYAKLCIAINEKNPADFMKENIAGEYTTRELDDSFLR